jgi:hypothetical protein
MFGLDPSNNGNDSCNNLTLALNYDSNTQKRISYALDSLCWSAYNGNDSSGCGTTHLTTGPDIDIRGTAWKHYKAWVKRADYNTTNGQMKVWLDGVLIAHITNMNSNPIDRAISHVFKKIEIGGYNSGQKDTHFQGSTWYLDVDNVYIGTTEKGSTPGTTHTLTVIKTGNGSGTVASSPAGLTCGTTCSALFTDNSNVALTFTAAAGSVVSGVTGCTLSGNQCTVAMGTSDKSVTATFSTPGGESEFNWSNTSYSVGEDAGIAKVGTINRTGDTTGPASVYWQTFGNTAVSTQDYAGIYPTLVEFTDGEISKDVFLEILEDFESEPTETLNIRLSSPVNGYLGSNYSATLSILDNDNIVVTNFNWINIGNGFILSSLVDDPDVVGITLNPATITNAASGSDNWPITEDSNGVQWTTFGDGGGFNSSLRASIGVSRIEGPKEAYTGVDTWDSGEDFSGWSGKSKGILAVGTTLYLWRSGIGSDSLGFDLEQLYKSTDSGVTFNEVGSGSLVKWEPADFSPTSPRFSNCTFVQFGNGYNVANIPDAVEGYVYLSCLEVQQPSVWNVQSPGVATMMRVPTASIETKSAYQWYTGSGWSSNLADRAPIFSDATNGLMRHSLTYMAGIDKYVLIGQQVDRFTANDAHIGIYVSDNPWGPWSTLLFENAVTSGITEVGATKTVFWGLSTKWSSGNDFVIVGTLPGADEFGTMEGSFVAPGLQ